MPFNYIALYDTGEPLPYFIGTVSTYENSPAAREQNVKQKAFNTLVEKFGAVDADAYECIKIVGLFDTSLHIG